MLPRVTAAADMLPTAPAAGALDLGAADLIAAYRTGTLAPGDVVDACLAAIHADRLGSCWAVDDARALAAAERSAARWASGRPRLLEGVPVVVKDLLDTASLTTTGGTRWLADRVPVADAAVVAAVRAAGGVVVAKTSTAELGCGNEQFAFGNTLNPWDTSRITGGSSAGSAAALAARLAPLALGTDTGGSIRIPAAYCGVVGLKPTLGRLSCEGIVGLAPTLDCPGPMARSAVDAGLLFEALDGDPTSRRTDLYGVRLAVPRRFFHDIIEPDVAARFAEATACLSSLGAKLVEVELDHVEHGAALSWLITMYEANQSYLAAPRDLLMPTFRGQLEVGEEITADQYNAALHARRALAASVTAALAGFDAAVIPAALATAPPFADVDRAVAGVVSNWPDVSARTFAVWNVTGLPALAIPIGRGDDGLPVGIQLAGTPWSDTHLLSIATAFQSATSHHLRQVPR